ncbi:hypothetical protein BOX15_Mlig018281g2 [Macrostomum lignano]|uniref:NIPA-like protein 2 n=2 Tax=Macrostomum lignano TaxID=282301 RepID=A0A267E8R5_9PLAT|nr:hypothetical protein BOX15_Mlig018281g3 [Macrostomum lignano]PAA88044.1 hypothetical protein BOX15_Mlig018281g2 [Macrostomum lignano]
MASPTKAPYPDTTPMGSNVTSSGSNLPRAKEFQEIFIGCLLAIIGNLMISISLNIQKYTHNKDEKLLEADRKHYLKRPLWWIGVIMMILGEVGNFAAYGFAPASVVAPLGTSTVIANMFIAVIFLREQLRPEDLFGSGLAVVGAFLIVSFSKRKEHVFNAVQVVQALVSARFIIYITIEASALVVLFFLLYVLKRDNVLVLLLITSIIASMTVICAKAVSGLLNLTIAGSPQYRHPVLYIMAVIMLATCILQVHYLNLAMKGSDSTVVVPTNFVFFTISAIASGIVFFNEFAGLYSLSIFMFLLGCLLSFIGVYFITFNRVPEADKAPAAAAAAASRDDDDATGPAAKSADASMESLTTDDRAGLIGDKQTAAAAGKKKSQKVLSGQFPSWLDSGSVTTAEVQPKSSGPAEGNLVEADDGQVNTTSSGGNAGSGEPVDAGAADFLAAMPSQ